jgi:hypothetical protein
MTAKTGAHHLEPFMAGLKFPADKDRVLESALRNHAPKDVLDLVEQLARQSFVVPQDVIEAYEELRIKGLRASGSQQDIGRPSPGE